MNWKNRGMEKQSDATSVQPLWHSLVDLSIIGLDVEDGDDAGVTVSEAGKKIRGLWKWHRGYCSAVMDGSVVGAASVRCMATRLKQDKTNNVNLKWDSNIICNR